MRAAFVSFPDYMDPQLSYTNEGWVAMRDTYIPLLTYRHAGGRAGSEIVPGLARGLPKLSNGGRTYTLFLRRGLTYSDGTPVRASDFEYAVKRMIHLFSGGFPFYLGIDGARRYQRTGRGGIAGIVADDRSGRIAIHLNRPDGTFPDKLALMFAAPVPKSTPMRDQSFDPPPATGPYVITKSSPSGWEYERNPAWTSGNNRRISQVPRGHMDRIEVRVIRDLDAEVRGVLNGTIDWMQNPPPGEYGQFERKYGGTQFRTDPSPSIFYFWLNTTAAPFDDLRVREAVNYAVDPEALLSLYEGRLQPAHQIVPPGLPGYRSFDLFPYDLAKARRLLAAADPSDRKLTVWASTEIPNLEATEYFAAVLRQLGFTVTLKVINADAYFTVIGNRKTPNLDAGWSDWFADFAHPDDFIEPLLLGSSILPLYNGNFAQLAVPSLDKETERLSRLPLGAAVERRYAALDRAYMEQAPWVPYGSYVLSTFVSKRVDLDRVVFNPLFGADLVSFRFK